MTTASDVGGRPVIYRTETFFFSLSHIEPSGVYGRRILLLSLYDTDTLCTFLWKTRLHYLAPRGVSRVKKKEKNRKKKQKKNKYMTGGTEHHGVVCIYSPYKSVCCMVVCWSDLPQRCRGDVFVCAWVCVSVVACCLYKYTLQCLSIKLEAFLLHSVSQMLHALRIATKQSVDAPWEGVWHAKNVGCFVTSDSVLITAP